VAWQEFLGFAGLFTGGGLLVVYSDQLTLPRQIVLWSLLLVTFAILLRHGWVRLFGPLFLFDLIRTTRRSRYLLFRFYVYFVLLVLATTYLLWATSEKKESLPAREAAMLGQQLFFIFMGSQFVLAALLTPGYTASAIAEQKERRTLEFLLTTDLQNREIVLSQLFVRLGMLLLTLLTGLPILCLLQFLGGVEPDLILAGFVATAVTVSSLASLGLLNSVYARRPRDAIVYTYLEMTAYLLLTGLAQAILITRVSGIIVDLGVFSFSVGGVVNDCAAGNPVVVTGKLMADIGIGRVHLGYALRARLGQYVVFHGILTLVFAVWASVRLRAIYLRQSYGETAKPPLAAQLRFRPGVGSWPLSWKELVAEPGFRFRWFGRVLLALLLIGSFVPALYIYLRSTWVPRDRVREALAVWTQSVGAMVSCLLLLGVAVRAASSITSERDRQTWDSLLMTPLDSTPILAAKWLGSVASVRWGWLWLGLIWGTGVAADALPLRAIPLLAVAWMLYAGVFALIGLGFSSVCRTSLRAITCTIFSTVAFAAGLIGMPLSYLRYVQRTGFEGPFEEWLGRFQQAVTPPIVLARLIPSGTSAPQDWPNQRPDWELKFALLGLLCWALVGGVLWTLACVQFRKATNRNPLRRPEPASGVSPVLPRPAPVSAP
jgi:ABC-type transport system involved in multi-copper enzyme maturation permease subunit